MKSLWKNILDGLTYPDLAGRRQLRSHTVMAIAILILLGLTSSFIFFRKTQFMSQVRATPIAVQITETVIVQPTATQIVEVYEPGCPTDPAQWSFADPVISQNYKMIQPACVYQGLEKTIAWALAVRSGYSRAQATEMLGFEEMPMRQLDQVKIPTEAGLLDMPVSFIPPYPDLSEWRLTAQGNSAVTYALRGCFRTSTVVGNRVEIWGGDYPVICLVVEDAENTYSIYSLNGHVYTSVAVPLRSFLLFGYIGDGSWVWIGTQTDPKKEITDPQAAARDRMTIATLYDSQPWDPAWLKRTYDLEMQRPPENWQSLRDDGEKQAILFGLSQGGVTP